MKPTTCPRCGTEILASDLIAGRHHQVVELALASRDVSQYTIHVCRCKGCGERVKAQLPPEAESYYYALWPC